MERESDKEGAQNGLDSLASTDCDMFGNAPNVYRHISSSKF